MPTLITFNYAGCAIQWDPVSDPELRAVLALARDVRALLDAADASPAPAAAPGRNVVETPPEPPRNAAEAEQRFFARYGETVGRDWRSVQRYLGQMLPKPATVAEWTLIAKRVRDAAKVAA
jgi:hypothetical protein